MGGGVSESSCLISLPVHSSSFRFVVEEVTPQLAPAACCHACSSTMDYLCFETIKSDKLLLPSVAFVHDILSP